MIFTLALTLYYRAYAGVIEDLNDPLAELEYDANVIADSFVTTGYPVPWSNLSVQRIGIMNDGVVNRTKLLQLQAIPIDAQRELLGTRFDYGLFFSNGTHTLLIESCTFGSPSLVSTNTSLDTCTEPSLGVAAEILIKSERIVIHEGRLVSLVVYAWE